MTLKEKPPGCDETRTREPLRLSTNQLDPSAQAPLGISPQQVDAPDDRELLTTEMANYNSRTSRGASSYDQQPQHSEPHSNQDFSFIETPAPTSIPVPTLQPPVSIEDSTHYHDLPTNTHMVRPPYEYSYTSPPVHHHIDTHAERRRSSRAAHPIHRDPPVGDAVTMSARGALTTDPDPTHHHNLPANTRTIRTSYRRPAAHYPIDAHRESRRSPHEAHPMNRNPTSDAVRMMGARGGGTTHEEFTHHHDSPNFYSSMPTYENLQTPHTVNYQDVHPELPRSPLEAHQMNRDLPLSDAVITAPQSFYEKHFSSRVGSNTAITSKLVTG